MERLKNALGIDSNIEQTVLYNEINKSTKRFVEISQLRKRWTITDTDMMSNIIEIQDVGIFYIKVNLRLDLIVTEGFVYRPYTTNTRKETLNDYIYASNRGSGTYTARVTKETLMWLVISPISLTFQKYTPQRNVGHFQL
jgi:hypothetical protein